MVGIGRDDGPRASDPTDDRPHLSERAGGVHHEAAPLAAAWAIVGALETLVDSPPAGAGSRWPGHGVPAPLPCIHVPASPPEGDPEQALGNRTAADPRVVRCVPLRDPSSAPPEGVQPSDPGRTVFMRVDPGCAWTSSWPSTRSAATRQRQACTPTTSSWPDTVREYFERSSPTCSGPGRARSAAGDLCLRVCGEVAFVERLPGSRRTRSTWA